MTIGNKIKMLINAVWAIPIVFLIRLLRPYISIHLGALASARIGHYVLDATECLARLKSQSINRIDLFWIESSCNMQWEKMVKRSLPIYSWVRYLDRWNCIIPGGMQHHRIGSSMTSSRDIEGLYNKHDVKIRLLPEEEREAKRWLVTQGWQEGEPFVCLLVRDSAYLENNVLHKDKRDWSYHNYRDSDIDTYIKAMEWLAAQGVWVLRMGEVMHKRIASKHLKIIDYAFCSQKSDLLDIWLFANCAACISTGTGLDAVSTVYGRPVFFLNVLPFSNLYSFSKSMWVPKNLRWMKNKAPLSLSEYLHNSYYMAQDYFNNGIEIIDLSPDEILQEVQEFWHRVKGSFVETAIDRQLQQKFWSVLKAWPEFTKLHGWIHPESCTSSSWLRSQCAEFFEENSGQPPEQKKEGIYVI